MAVPHGPAWKPDAGDESVEPERRRHIAGGERGKIDAPRAALADHRYLGVERGGDRNQLGRRVEVTERTAERAAAAGLPVPDLRDRFVHQRAAPAHQVGKLDVALARHGADFERTIVFADVAQAVHPAEIE